MQRRALLKGLLVAGVPVAAAAAIKSRNMLKRSADVSLEALHGQMRELKAQFESFQQSENRNRKLAKAAVAMAALSLGVDVSALL
jgi:hypothetical protein